MKAKQAFEILTSGTYQYQDTLEAVAVAVKALKKQIPQKPYAIEEHQNFKVGKCPQCNYRVFYAMHCPDCGQMLDWNVSENTDGKEG